MNKEKYIKFIEGKIQACIDARGMEREKWAFIQCLKKARELEKSSITAVGCQGEQLPSRKRECNCSGMSDKVKCGFECYS